MLWINPINSETDHNNTNKKSKKRMKIRKEKCSFAQVSLKQFGDALEVHVTRVQ